MQIETLPPATQKRVLRFVQDLAEAFRRIQAEAKVREQDPPAADQQKAAQGDRHESGH